MECNVSRASMYSTSAMKRFSYSVPASLWNYFLKRNLKSLINRILFKPRLHTQKYRGLNTTLLSLTWEFEVETRAKITSFLTTWSCLSLFQDLINVKVITTVRSCYAGTPNTYTREIKLVTNRWAWELEPKRLAGSRSHKPKGRYPWQPWKWEPPRKAASN